MEPIRLKCELKLDELTFLVREAKDFAFSNGLVMGMPGSPDVTFLPFCLLPSPFPKEWFSRAMKAQTALSLLLHRVARDTEFLKKCLAKTAESDIFIRRLLDIHEKVLAEGYAQELTLGVFRMDYMLDTVGETISGLKQVEMNTIASSSIANSSTVYALQKHVLRLMNAPEINFPDVSVVREAAKGIYSAWQEYGVMDSIIVFLVEPDEENFADQRKLEYAIYKLEASVTVIRITMNELHVRGSLRGRTLYVDSHQVSVVYLRAGYSPDHYCEDSWSVRLMLERSTAILCPNVPLQLAGTKKVQQELTRTGVLEAFLKDVSEETLVLIRSLFAGQFSLDETDEGDRSAEMVVSHPDRYVMKPQREGGGNNIFGSEIPRLLRTMSKAERATYVLMELISPPPQPNYVIRRNRDSVPRTMVVGELGIYGVILGGQDSIIKNSAAGQLLRCKAEGSNEGGIAIGLGAISVPYLV